MQKKKAENNLRDINKYLEMMIKYIFENIQADHKITDNAMEYKISWIKAT